MALSACRSMKVRVSSLLASLAAVFLVTLNAWAQDALPILETQDPIHQELNLGEDKILLYDHFNHYGQVKDTVQSATPRQVAGSTAKTAKAEGNKNNGKESEGEDVLSFNFLYYMIQKFKMTDLVGK